MTQRFKVTLLAVSRPLPVFMPEDSVNWSGLLGFTEATSNRPAAGDCP